MLAPTIYLLQMLNAAEWLPQTCFSQSSKCLSESFPWHGELSTPRHGDEWTRSANDQPLCLSDQKPKSRTGRYWLDMIGEWWLFDDYLNDDDYDYWWMMMSTACYFSSRRRWFFGAWRCSRSLDQGPNHLWISATISNVSSRVPPYNTLKNLEWMLVEVALSPVCCGFWQFSSKSHSTEVASPCSHLNPSKHRI